jgi:fructoselysine-6-phosphate deglycase
LPGIRPEFRRWLSPVVMAAVLQRVSKNLEDITGHSLDIRRYYRKESY